MQIFILHKNIEQNAEMYCDKHCIKIITEICQILSTVHRKRNDYNIPEFLYKKTHEKHPCVLWCGESLRNYWYCCHLGLALYNEYQFRFNKPENFKKAMKILFWCIDHPIRILKKEYTPFALAMPKEYKTNDAVLSYRQYYLNDKKHLFKWTKREIPEWIKTKEINK